jgi:hypothetical protein
VWFVRYFGGVFVGLMCSGKDEWGGDGLGVVFQRSSV